MLSHSRTDAGASESRLVWTDSFTEKAREAGGPSSSLVVVTGVAVSIECSSEAFGLTL